MKTRIVMISLLFLLVAGCMKGCETQVSGLCEIFGESSAHCIQKIAVETENPELCESIPLMEKFGPADGNPPKDKCFLLIAEKTGNSSLCNRIDGGLISYTIEECYSGAALKNENPDICSGSPKEQECRTAVASADSTNNCGKGYVWSSGSKACTKVPYGKNRLQPGEKAKMRIHDIEGSVLVRKADGSLFQLTEDSDIGETDLQVIFLEGSWSKATINGKEFEVPSSTVFTLDESLDTLEGAVAAVAGVR
jgi:hypothetical protein